MFCGTGSIGKASPAGWKPPLPCKVRESGHGRKKYNISMNSILKVGDNLSVLPRKTPGRPCKAQALQSGSVDPLTAFHEHECRAGKTANCW